MLAINTATQNFQGFTVERMIVETDSKVVAGAVVVYIKRVIIAPTEPITIGALLQDCKFIRLN